MSKSKTALFLVGAAGLAFLLFSGKKKPNAAASAKPVGPPAPGPNPTDLAQSDQDAILESDDGTPPIVVDTSEGDGGQSVDPMEGGTSRDTFGPPGGDPSTWHPPMEDNATPNPADPNPTNDPMFGAPSALDAELKKTAASMGKTTEQAADLLATDISDGARVLPISAAETSKQLDPLGTIALARLLLSRENLSGWKTDLADEIRTWQGPAGLTIDGKFGPKSAARMAQEVGIVPLVRFWPSNRTLAQGLKTYRDEMGKTLAALKKQLPDSQAQILGVDMSQRREKGQAFGSDNPPPAQTLDFVQDVMEAIEDLGDKTAAKEIRA